MHILIRSELDYFGNGLERSKITFMSQFAMLQVVLACLLLSSTHYQLTCITIKTNRFVALHFASPFDGSARACDKNSIEIKFSRR